MQRRNVDLPDPEGPIRHMTCPRGTSSEIPFSTSSRPKRLCTPSALIIAWLTADRSPTESEPARQGQTSAPPG